MSTSEAEMPRKEIRFLLLEEEHVDQEEARGHYEMKPPPEKKPTIRERLKRLRKKNQHKFTYRQFRLSRALKLEHSEYFFKLVGTPHQPYLLIAPVEARIEPSLGTLPHIISESLSEYSLERVTIATRVSAPGYGFLHFTKFDADIGKQRVILLMMPSTFIGMSGFSHNHAE